jgi:Carbohydrate esterase 2 N-terminal/GDSL-like Lipase/Acylhydrolase family
MTSSLPSRIVRGRPSAPWWAVARGALTAGSALAGALCIAACAACSSTHGGAADASARGSDAAGTLTSEGGGVVVDGAAESGSSDDGASDAGASEGGVGVRWIGRVRPDGPGGPEFAWSGTGFVANVSGATISVKLKTLGSSDPIYFQPVIDLMPGTRFAVPNGEQTVTLASNLPDGNHVVELYRETEGRYGASVFEGFTDGTLGAPPPSPGRLIEVVGDSISAGYGDLGSEQHPNYGADPDGGCMFSTQTESAYASYGAVAAHSLSVDWSLIAVSGWGIYRDNGNSTANVLPAVYADELGLVTTPVWPFTPQPQAVVINLGTNDFAMGDPGQTQFEGAYSAFIATVRGKYPDAWIFCTVGPLLYGTGLATATTYIQAVVAMARAAGDMKVQYLDFGQQNASLGTGCQYHPNTIEHKAMAAKLVTALRTALGW